MKANGLLSVFLLLHVSALPAAAQETALTDTFPVRTGIMEPRLPLKEQLLALPQQSVGPVESAVPSVLAQPAALRYGLGRLTAPAVSPYALPNLAGLSASVPLSLQLSGSRYGLPGLVDARAVSIGRSVAMGPLELYGGSSLTQVGSGFGGSYTAPAVNGTMALRVNSWLTVGGYGQLAPAPGSYMPLYAPMTPQSRYGGFADIKFSRHWGIHMEYGREINPFTGKWETRRSISPMYYK